MSKSFSMDSVKGVIKKVGCTIKQGVDFCMGNSVLKPGIVLGIIALSVGLLLSVANFFTKDTIAAAKAKEITNALSQVLPAAQSFEEMAPEGADAMVTTLYVGKDASGETAGYCVQTQPSGYGGAIVMMVGIAKDGSVQGVSITESSETPGLGALASEDKFKKQYEGLTEPAQVNKDGGDIEAISGATITSRAVTSGVNAALETVRPLLEEAGGAAGE